MHQFRNRFSVGHVVEPAAHEGRLVIRTRQLDACKGQAIGIGGRSFELALWPEVPVEVGVADLVSPDGQLAAEINLERVASVVVHKNFHDRPINLTTKTWLL